MSTGCRTKCRCGLYVPGWSVRPAAWSEPMCGRTGRRIRTGGRREPQEETMLKTMTMIVIGATLALLALTPATEARKAGGTQQEYKQDPNKARAITKPTDKATPL